MMILDNNEMRLVKNVIVNEAWDVLEIATIAWDANNYKMYNRLMNTLNNYMRILERIEDEED